VALAWWLVRKQTMAAIFQIRATWANGRAKPVTRSFTSAVGNLPRTRNEASRNCSSSLSFVQVWRLRDFLTVVTLRQLCAFAIGPERRQLDNGVNPDFPGCGGFKGQTGRVPPDIALQMGKVVERALRVRIWGEPASFT
jgi:hypothetical protein